MLYLISLGISSEKDMSIKALEAAKECDFLYVELYTNKMDTSARKLSELVGKEVIELPRSGMEEDSRKIIEKAKNGKVGIFVGGDALSATTHSSLLLEAREAGIETRVIHGSSIFSAIGETGLQLYKFGKTVTLAYPEEGYKPEVFYRDILNNMRMGLHTLVLLDIKHDKMKYMTINDALDILQENDKEKVFGDSFKIVCVSRLGSSDQEIIYDEIKNIKNKKIEKTPSVLVIPGKLHFMEEEFLISY